MSPPGSDRRFAESERFVALVAHELKGQLVVLERIAAGLDSAAASGDADRLHSDSARIQRIARDLVETIEALRIISNPDVRAADQTSVSLHQAATEAVELLQDTIASQQIQVEIAPDLPSIPGSPILWRQVYRNLIENAVKACAGVERARIEIGCEQHDGDVVCFVRDNGCGLAHLDHESPLFGSETGLGLFLVQRIIERSAGRVWVAERGMGASIEWTVAGTSRARNSILLKR
jgi:signal transduction histidine kinase